MRSLILVLCVLASHTLVWGQLKAPLSNAVLLNDLQGNGQDILNLGTVSLGSGPQGTRRIHLVPNGSPTTPADGIGFGNDVTLYRSSNGTLTLNGNLVINGTLNTTSGDEANLQSLKQVPPLLNNFIVGTGTGWVGKNTAQTRDALGLTPLATANLVTSAYIADGTIVNADLAPGVALANLIGGTGSETGGALTDRGLRVAFVGNAPNSDYLVEAAIHNGTSETLQSANFATNAFKNGIMIRWLPVGQPPTSGSQLQVWGLGTDKVLRLLTSATLSSTFTNNYFVGSQFVVVASSVGTTPGYFANWEIGGMTVFID
jgi:hypothetical protein